MPHPERMPSGAPRRAHRNARVSTAVFNKHGSGAKLTAKERVEFLDRHAKAARIAHPSWSWPDALRYAGVQLHGM
jgi:hypothetical protein